MRALTAAFATLIGAVLLTNSCPIDAAEERHEDARERFLFIWAGDETRTKPDFLAVIDFDDHSPRYGAVIATVPLPDPGSTGNEPHHVGLSADGRVLAAGGLLSVLKGQKEVFFFDISNPRAPRFLSSDDPPQSAITDDFYPLPEGGFLVTMMGGANGHAPGRVAEFNQKLELVAEHPANPPEDGFNPHGISVRPELNLMLTSDFICPLSTLHAMPGNPDFRGSIRVWKFRERQIVRTIAIPHAAGTIDVHLIPGDRRARAYTAGMLDDKLYLVDPNDATAKPVFDFASIQKGGWPQLMRMTADGRRLFITMNQAGKVVMFDTSDPDQPKVLRVLDLGAESGPHYLRLSADERRLVVSDYFLNEDAAGKVHAEGDHKVHVIAVTRDSMHPDPRFRLNFNTAFASGRARPHGLVMK
ncbi:MAG TPA: selenium-binding protein SBP56-related protein [Bryobacteraceae bacterium]|nr:selenium-binding protein SBP56-related protein [Bryobacteraceae bacterium]